jgi:hypothetical protein
MSAHPTPARLPQAPYAPTFGELVRDRTTGRVGTYMGPGFSKKRPTVFLRPPRGGYEWEVSVSDIEPAAAEPELETVNNPAPAPW